MEKNPLNIFDTIKTDNISGISTDLIEAGIDQFIENDLLKDIPFFGIGYKTYRLTQNISEYFFTKKVLNFLFQLKDISTEKRVGFLSELEKKEGFTEAGEKILITLNRLEDSDKAIIIGKLFKATINEKIEIRNFIRLMRMVDKAYLEDLNLIKFDDNLYHINDETKFSLHQAGFLNQTIKDNRDFEKRIFESTGSSDFEPPTFEYELNIYGRILIEF
jgi:hypothetical protein